jgi:hypothetical protein
MISQNMNQAIQHLLGSTSLDSSRDDSFNGRLKAEDEKPSAYLPE